MPRSSFATIFAAIFVAVLSVSAFAANSLTYTTIDNPGDPTFNQLLGISNSGVITGYFGSGQAGHPNIGYTIAPPYTKYSPDMLPASAQTQATGIQTNGDTVGFWAPTNQGVNLDANYGFIRLANGFTYLSVNNPLVSSYPEINQLTGLSNGIAVGFYNDFNNNANAYYYTQATGVFTPVTVANASSTTATGINKSGLICGFFTASGGSLTQGFVQNLKGETMVTFSISGTTTTQFLGINDQGVAVGQYLGSDNLYHGFTYSMSSGTLTYVDDPNAVQGTTLNGINDKGQAVGYYVDAAGNFHGMLVTGVQ